MKQSKNIWTALSRHIIYIAVATLVVPSASACFAGTQVIRHTGVSAMPGAVRYKVEASRWIMPMQVGDYEDATVATLSLQNPMFQWMPPVIGGIAASVTYTYDIKIVQVMPEQALDQAIDSNPVVYQTKGLSVPQCLLPINIVQSLEPEALYVAQVVTHAHSTVTIDIANDGRGSLMPFRVQCADNSNSQTKN